MGYFFWGKGEERSMFRSGQQLQRGGGVNFRRIANFLQPNVFLIGVREAQIAGTEHDRLNAFLDTVSRVRFHSMF